MRFAGSKRITDFLGTKADWAGIGNTAVQDTAESAANVAINNARAADARMGAEAQVKAAGHYADATKAAGQAAGQASMVSGIAGGIGGLGGLFGGGGGFGGGSAANLSGVNISHNIGSNTFTGSGFNSSGPWSHYGSSFGSSYW